ncbi:crotonyl-CoA carboxylase/reductase, partial [Parafrankia sp. BMG5.11]
MKRIVEAIMAGDARSPERRAEFGALAVPESYRGVVVRKDEVGMFEGRVSREKDPRESLHV